MIFNTSCIRGVVWFAQNEALQGLTDWWDKSWTSKVAFSVMKVLWSKLEAKLLQGLLEFCNRQNLSLRCTAKSGGGPGF